MIENFLWTNFVCSSKLYMKLFLRTLLIVPLLAACHNSDKKIVSTSFADSLITHYSPSALARTVDGNLLFWQRRMDSLPENYVNGPEYAAALLSRFRLYGDIQDLHSADSLFYASNKDNQGKEPGLWRTEASLAMLQHRFNEADSFLQKAISIEGQTVANTFMQFDVAFELGRYGQAKNILTALAKDKSYPWLFRQSKYEHYDGSLDSAISCMLQAAAKSAGNRSMRQITISNAADLYIHKGDLAKAEKLYRESIGLDAADFHSIMGLGWIALVHDKNDSLAEKIFQFVQLHQQSPDVLLKLEQVAEARDDKALQTKYATEFMNKTSNPSYGNMYNKYLIDLYTGVLQMPAKAVAIAEKEITNRATPQTYAWYAWSLFCNNEKEKAYTIFKGFVSGKPLEGLELFYMGRMMQAMSKGYNAQQFYKAAYKNRYDLSPAKVKYLNDNLE
jgi:tetratricopeptide (TPR) repeat protein